MARLVDRISSMLRAGRRVRNPGDPKPRLRAECDSPGCGVAYVGGKAEARVKRHALHAHGPGATVSVVQRQWHYTKDRDGVWHGELLYERPGAPPEGSASEG